MKLTENQLKTIIAESTKRVLSEIGYHEKQKRDQSEEEHEAWLKKKSAAKKRYYDSQKKDDDKGGAIDHYDYKHGKGNFRPVKSGEKVDETINRIVKNVINETTLDYDMDNFSGRWNRGQRCQILVDGYPYYQDVPEESVDRLIEDLMERLGYTSDEIEVVDL